MTVPTINFAVTRGDDYSASLTFDQPVAGFSDMRFTAREQWAETQTDNTDAAVSVTLTPTGTYTAQLDLTSAQTLALTLRAYVYDVQVTVASGGKKYTTQRGRLSIDPDATR
jgi:hypothetical protein